MKRSFFLVSLLLVFMVSACAPVVVADQSTRDIANQIEPVASLTPFMSVVQTATTSVVLPATATPLPHDPKLMSFIEECYQPSTFPTCLYSKGLFSLHLDYSGAGNLPDYGARVWDEAWVYGQVIGILAHDHKDGRFFSQLSLGSEIYVIQSTGSNEKYVVISIDRWKSHDRLKHLSPWDGGQEVEGMELVDRYYRGGNNFDRLVFQTCINGDKGLLFVVAYRQ